jgi:3-methyladenine DNA glycosylase Mpg
MTETCRKIVAKRIYILQKQHPTHSIHPETRTIKSIQRKLEANDAMLARADKGNTIAILPITQYETKIQDFTSSNNFHIKTKDPTKIYQTQIRITIKQSQNLIPKER